MNNITKDAKQAADWINQGKILVYPTESVWGIGCDPFNKQAVEKILTIKKRPVEKGMIVVTDSISRIEPLLKNLPEQTRQQIIESWKLDVNSPTVSKHQATTWLIPTSKSGSESQNLINIPQWITGSHDCVAVRVISHPLIRKLCSSCVSQSNPYGFVVSTSCNPSGAIPASNFTQAYNYFEDNVYYLQGETLGFVLPSQIKNAFSGETLR